MEILKIKDWVKVKEHQFVVKYASTYNDDIISCSRIKDNKEFVVDETICISTTEIKNTLYRIDVCITHMDEDCIHVKLICVINDTEKFFYDSTISKRIPINEVEHWRAILIESMKVKIAMNPNLLDAELLAN